MERRGTSSITYSPFLLDSQCVNIPAVRRALSSGDLSWYSVYVKHRCNSYTVKWSQKNVQINTMNYWTL